jgi:hypothetical protein
MDLKNPHFEGRYPHKVTRLDPKKMTVEVISYKDEAVFRLDDEQNLDFWLQFTVTKDELKAILEQMESNE